MMRGNAQSSNRAGPQEEVRRWRQQRSDGNSSNNLSANGSNGDLLSSNNPEVQRPGRRANPVTNVHNSKISQPSGNGRGSIIGETDGGRSRISNGRSNHDVVKPSAASARMVRGSSSFMSCGHNGYGTDSNKPDSSSKSSRDQHRVVSGQVISSKASNPVDSREQSTARSTSGPVSRVSSSLSGMTISSSTKMIPATSKASSGAHTPTNANQQETTTSKQHSSSQKQLTIITGASTSSSSTQSKPEAPSTTMTPPHPHLELRGCPPPEDYLLRQWMKGPSIPEGTVVNISDRPSLCMSVRGNEACIGSSDHALYIVDCNSCTFVKALYGKQYGHTEWVTCCDYLADGRILSGGMDGKLCLWDKKGVRSYDLKGHSASISAVKAGAEGSLAVSASYDKTLMLWNVSRLQTKVAGCLKGHKGAVLGFCLSSQGSVVSGSREGEVILWDAARATPVLNINGAHDGHVTAIECLEDTKHKTWEECRECFLTGGQDGVLQVWDFRTRGPVQSVALHRNATGKGAVSSIAVSYTATGSGPIVVTAGADNLIKVTEPRKGYEVLHTLSSHRDFIYSLYVSGPLAWSGGADGSLLVHELLTGQCLYGLGADSKGAVRCISLAGPDRLVVCGDDGNVMIYSL